jgi:hypothetical protein
MYEHAYERTHVRVRTCEIIGPGSLVISVTLTNTSRAVAARMVDCIVAADASHAKVTFFMAYVLSIMRSTMDFKEVLILESHPVIVIKCSSSA